MSRYNSWAEVLADTTLTLASLYSETAEMEAAEIRGRAEAMSMSRATSASAMENEAKVQVAEIRAEIVRLNARIKGLQHVLTTVTTFINVGVEYADILNPLQ